MWTEADRTITCCFTGHRPEKLPWGQDESSPDCIALKQKIAQSLAELYHQNFRHFISGMAQGCDIYFIEAALTLRETYPDVVLEAAIPCPSQTKYWPKTERTRYQSILERCDMETMVEQRYTQGCMHHRDRYMVDRSSMLLAVYNGSGGGTRYTVNYAQRHNVQTLFLSF